MRGIFIRTIDKSELKTIVELKSNELLTSTPVTSNQDYNGFLFFELPRFKTGFDAWNLVQFTVSGNTPVRLDFPLMERYSYEVEFPAWICVVYASGDIDIKNDLGELEINISQSGPTVKIERSWEILKDVISSDLMDEFKVMILAWEKVDYRKIVLKKK